MELITLHPELAQLISMRKHSCQNYAMVSSPKAKKYNKILGGGSQELIDREDKMVDRMKKANKRFENDR